MTRIALWTLAAIMVALPASASAESYRAGPLGAWDQNGDVSCEGGDMLVFPAGEFDVIPHAADDQTIALIDSRSSRAKVGGDAARDLERLKEDADICAGPVDCEDWEAVSAAMQQCWEDEPEGPPTL
jgi:hypothetical protein